MPLRNVSLLLFSTTIAIISSIGCGGDPVEFTAIGDACSREAETLCESPAGDDQAGPCLLDLPGGMCSYDCSDDEGVCPEGYSCGELTDGRYCLMDCDDDGDCRGDMICVLEQCRGLQVEESACEEDDDCAGGLLCVLEQCLSPQPFGAECGEDADCRSEICHDELCSERCGGQADCEEGVSCVYQGGELNLCLDLDFGEDCDRDNDCPSGVCYDDECNLECHDDWDCEEGLSCVDLGDGVPLCVEFDPPEVGDGGFGENCTFSGCGGGFECLSLTEDREDDPYAFCTRSCLNDLDCPAEMTCRRSQKPGEEEIVLRCVPREYCERCASDDQCGGGELCVSQDPRHGPGRYCSQTCDIERPVTTCPTDSSCHEALWCEPDRAWVPDCEWCSDPEACEAPEGGARAQCFHDYGACAGNGEDYCSPCHVDGDCPAGGACRYDAYRANSYCTMPCEEEGGLRSCPFEHYCVQFGDPFLNDFECLPRQGSCSQPSGGVGACYPCDGFGDCVSGYCLPDDRGASYCMVDCSKEACPPYTECSTFVDDGGNPVAQLCVPVSDLRDCVEVQYCIEDCPEGPGSCSADARAYCR